MRARIAPPDALVTPAPHYRILENNHGTDRDLTLQSGLACLLERKLHPPAILDVLLGAGPRGR